MFEVLLPVGCSQPQKRVGGKIKHFLCILCMCIWLVFNDIKLRNNMDLSRWKIYHGVSLEQAAKLSQEDAL
jgi:hypothetical protein